MEKTPAQQLDIALKQVIDASGLPPEQVVGLLAGVMARRFIRANADRLKTLAQHDKLALIDGVYTQMALTPLHSMIEEAKALDWKLPDE